jgi:hypothetical protein
MGFRIAVESERDVAVLFEGCVGDVLHAGVGGGGVRAAAGSMLRAWRMISSGVSRKQGSGKPMRWASWPKSQTLERASPGGSMACCESCTK